MLTPRSASWNCLESVIPPSLLLFLPSFFVRFRFVFLSYLACRNIHYTQTDRQSKQATNGTAAAAAAAAAATAARCRCRWSRKERTGHVVAVKMNGYKESSVSPNRESRETIFNS